MAPDTPERRLGVFGGTFDPLHVGHLIAAQDVLEVLSLDRILFVPAVRSPLKSGSPQASATVRLQMVRSATEGDSRFEVSDLEIQRGDPSYTLETLRTIRAERPATRLFLLLGVDQWTQFSKWHEPREIASLAELALVTRTGASPSNIDPELPDGSPPPFTEVSVTRIDVSATVIRGRVREGRSIRYLVPEPVRRIIAAGNLYLNGV